MRISDWSSDVCSSDLRAFAFQQGDVRARGGALRRLGGLSGRRFDRPGRAATAFGALGVAAAGGRGLRIMGDAVGILPLVEILRAGGAGGEQQGPADRKSTRLNSRH